MQSESPAHTVGLPEENAQYGTQEYWDERYQREGEEVSFDWFKPYSDIRDIVHELIPEHNSRILMLGCGNSKLSEEMYDDGFQNIVNVDYSSVLIEQMRHKHEISRPKMKWDVMDVRDLKYDTNAFDVAIDKGTMDAMATAKASVWDPPQQVIDDCTKEVDEVLRVLRPKTGMFIHLTFAQPHFRKRFLTREGTTLDVKALGEAFHYYLYIVRLSSPTPHGP